jgi:large subunit ribosomal protein L3
MTLGILATKKGMTQIFTDQGVRIPVTVLQIEPNWVVQKRTVETDGYTAVQIGYGKKNANKLNKPRKGHLDKAGVEPVRVLREFRCTPEQAEALEVGSQLSIDALGEEFASVDCSATSKGKGFAGVMKRHNFKGFRATHGTHEYFRHGGSIGCRAKPGKVFKGKKMAGQMGNERVTTLNLNLVEFDRENGLLLIRGAVPGGKNAVIEVRPAKHKSNRIPGLKEEAQMASKNPMKASKAAGKR